MQLFYRRLFPYRPLYLWLNQEQSKSYYHAGFDNETDKNLVPSKLFTHREFAFTLAGDVYLRYQSFNNVDEFKVSIARHIPSRFEIGPQYSARVCSCHWYSHGWHRIQPKDRKTLASGALQPQRRELVFDIDMTDYDEIRTCCTDKTICKRCWGFIAAAVKVLDHSLRGRLSTNINSESNLLINSYRNFWFQASLMGLLWSARYPLLDFWSNGFGSHRWSATSAGHFFGSYKGWQRAK